MVVDQSSRLHKCVHDGAAAELEAARNHIFTHGVGNRAGCRNLGYSLPAVPDGVSSGEPPKISIQ